MCGGIISLTFDSNPFRTAQFEDKLLVQRNTHVGQMICMICMICTVHDLDISGQKDTFLICMICVICMICMI